LSSAQDIAIRPATPEDEAVIRALVRAAYAKWVPRIGREPRPMTADYASAIREHDIDILTLDGTIAGVIEVMLRPDHLWIENIAIAPDHQGKGLGRHLLTHAEQKAIAAGQTALRLLTNGAFEANIALYQKAGYRIDRTEPFMGGITVYMSKSLTG
jgi:ribosomal protein S18 acetylase RimI-like enzyme